MNSNNNQTFVHKQARFQKEYQREANKTDEESNDDETDDKFMKQMRKQEKMIFGGYNGSKKDDQKIYFGQEQVGYNLENGIQDISKQVEKNLIAKNMMTKNNQNINRSPKEIDTLLQEGKKLASKNSVVHKNQQNFNQMVDEQLKKQNIVVKKGAIKSGFDIISSTNLLLKKQYEESVKNDEYDEQFAKKEVKFTKIINSLKYENKKKEQLLQQSVENLNLQATKLNGDNYGQSQLFNSSVNANNSNMLFNSSYYCNKFVTTLNQHSVLGCRATSTFALKENEENQKMIQSRIDEINEQLQDLNKKQFNEDTLEENMNYKIKEIQATKVVFEREIINYKTIIQNYDTQLSELLQKLDEYERSQSSFLNQGQMMSKFMIANEQQNKQYLIQKKGNCETQKRDIKNALQDHNQIQQQISKATIQIEKMKLEIEELDYQAKNKRQLTQQSQETLSVLENFDLLCDVFIYNDPASSNVMEVESASELVSKQKLFELQQNSLFNINNNINGNQNSNSNISSSNINSNNNLNFIRQIKKKNNLNNNSASTSIQTSPQIQPERQLLAFGSQNPVQLQRSTSYFNSKDNTPKVRSHSKTEEDNQDQIKQKLSESAPIPKDAQSPNKSLTAIDQSQTIQPETTQVNTDEVKTDQHEDVIQEEVIENSYKYKQGDIILRLTQFFSFHSEDLENAVNSVLSTFKNYNQDHDALKSRIVDLSIQKKNMIQLYKKLENELWEFILVFGDIKQQEEEEELQKQINRRLNKQDNDNIDDQDSASKNLLQNNLKKNTFNEQNNELDQAFDAQIFEGQCFLFLNESLFRVSKTINTIKYIICYSELFKEDMDVQNYYFKNGLFQDVSDILRFSLQTKMVYQERDVPFIRSKKQYIANTKPSQNNTTSSSNFPKLNNAKENSIVTKNNTEPKQLSAQQSISAEQNNFAEQNNGVQSSRNSYSSEFFKNQILHRDQPIEKSSHVQMALARSITKKYQKSSINKLSEIKSIFIEKFCPDLKKHEKLNTLIELIRNDIVIMYFCSIEMFHKFATDIKEQYMRQYDIEAVKEEKQIENLYCYAIDHLNQLRNMGEIPFRVYIKRSIMLFEYILLHLYLQSDKIWYDIKAFDPKFYLKDRQKSSSRKRRNKRTWREKLVSNKIKQYENYLGTQLEASQNNNAVMGVFYKEQISNFLNNDGQFNNQANEAAENEYFEEKRDNIKHPKAKPKPDTKRKAYTFVSEQDMIANNTNGSSDQKFNANNINIKNQQEQQIIRIDKEKMKEELQRCIGIKKNFQRRIQEADMSTLSKTINSNNSTIYTNNLISSNTSSLKLNSSSFVNNFSIEMNNLLKIYNNIQIKKFNYGFNITSFDEKNFIINYFCINKKVKVKTEENQSIYNMDYPFSKVFYKQKAKNQRSSQSTFKHFENNSNQSLIVSRKEDRDTSEVPKRLKRSISQQQYSQNQPYNQQQQNQLQDNNIQTERRLKNSSRKLENNKQQSLPSIKNNQFQQSVPQRYIDNNILPNMRANQYQQRLANDKSKATSLTKRNTNEQDLNSLPLGSLIQKTETLQSLKKPLQRKSIINQMPIEQLLNKQLYTNDETNIIHSGILSDDFNKNRGLLPNIAGKITDYSEYSYQNNLLI